jgi:hypothetical protein
MGLDDNRLTKSIFPLLCQNPKVARHAMCGPYASAKENLKMLVDELGGWEDSLESAKYVQDFSEYFSKIEELRKKIAYVRGVISKPLEYAATYENAKNLLSAVRRINLIDPRTSPVEAAEAYGAAMGSFGKLIQLLPPPANVVGTLIEEMGKIFAKVVGDIGLHTRGTSRRLDEQWKQANEGKSLFD